jgi:rhodanese-related sulfurtransferase
MYNLVNLILLIVIAYQIRTIYLSFRAPNIIPEELSALKKESKGKVEVIDVRSISRFRKENIKGSKNVPMSQVNDYTMGMRKDRTYVFLSQNGTQTGRVISRLVKEGYSVYNLKGGFRAWKKYRGE